MYIAICSGEMTQDYCKYFCKEEIERRNGWNEWRKNLTIIEVEWMKFGDSLFYFYFAYIFKIHTKNVQSDNMLVEVWYARDGKIRIVDRRNSMVQNNFTRKALCHLSKNIIYHWEIYIIETKISETQLWNDLGSDFFSR